MGKLAEMEKAREEKKTINTIEEKDQYEKKAAEEKEMKRRGEAEELQVAKEQDEEKKVARRSEKVAEETKKVKENLNKKDIDIPYLEEKIKAMDKEVEMREAVKLGRERIRKMNL